MVDEGAIIAQKELFLHRLAKQLHICLSVCTSVGLSALSAKLRSAAKKLIRANLHTVKQGGYCNQCIIIIDGFDPVYEYS